MASTATPQELQNHAVDLHKHVHTGFSGHMAETYNHRTGGCNIRLGKAMIAKALPHLLPPSTSSTEGPARNLRILDNACVSLPWRCSPFLIP
ncbi:uncharacterized protein KY384_009224 [Bacidia gigantensis]|uniref:uncharacterized protein n=1 Tax=Bacidia gigantensis TaxID=2732470 RepID=UPI001D045321|nr:uncharacterized protein KY384_009224 [Bacidia gigantensis]KAG8525580.1 hypothetical protein KY384_009224 [Bacidia gigantensis]